MTPVEKHRHLSIVKSALRLGGCASVVAGGGFVAFALWFGFAEIVGILEELVV